MGLGIVRIGQEGRQHHRASVPGIDGGNSNYQESQRRHRELKAEGFDFVYAGASGGIRDLKRATA
jgi:6-phosphogluconate dehydrogenase (decarboxylating)